MKTMEIKFFPIDIREQKIILRNEGNQIDENIFSDVIINIHSKPNDIFKRHNNYDLIYEQEVSIIDFYNEISINITHLDNRKYIIKYNSKSINNHEKENDAADAECSLLNKRILRIRDLGLPIGTSGRRGDLYIKLNIHLPKLSNEQIKLLQNLSFMEKSNEKETKRGETMEKEENNIIEIYAIL
jgi:DnaJ-class molecular chaperone